MLELHNYKSHLSLLTLMSLMGQANIDAAPKCQRLKKSNEARKRRLRAKAARRRQRRMQ